MSIPRECGELSLVFTPAGSRACSGSAASPLPLSWLHAALVWPCGCTGSSPRARVVVLVAAKIKLELGLSLTPSSCATSGRGAQGDHVLG